ncbi:DUF6297 family protein [Kocuria turfanensis]|uniref:Uncharacterized protein n=1 Tax=Kocuria turfanensis TaxID=388357 RepID=A0A512IIA2_9MICC|nr:DUF6297 family protein [Kocuria turfanensis]GEO97439.1 hypothetical protein KTU01_35620 [Kocuria turfanensis]
MTAGAGVEPAGPAEIEVFLRGARARTRGRARGADRFVDAYTGLFVTVVLVAWAVAGIVGLGASLADLVDAGSPGGTLHRPAGAWVGAGVPVLGAAVLLGAAWVGAVDLLRGLGPVGVSPERMLWVWPLPGAGAQEPIRAVRRTLWVAAVAGALVGGTGLLLLAGAGPAAGWGAPWWQVPAQLVCWAGLGISAVGVAVWAQTAREVPASLRSRPWAGWFLALGAVLVVLAGTQEWAMARWDVPPPPWFVAVAGALAVLAGLFWVWALRWARTLNGVQLRETGARTRHLSNAVALLSTHDLTAALAPTTVTGVRGLPGSTPGWVTGPHTVVLFASLTALRTTRWRASLIVDLGLTMVLLASFAHTAVLAGWTALLVVGYRGLNRGTAYLGDLRAGAAAERNLPIGPTAAALVHLVIPCALNTAILAAVALLSGLAAGTSWGVLLLLGAVAGAGIGAAGLYRALAPTPDHTQPPIDTPLGPVPVTQLIGYSRGLILVPALLTAPATVLLHPTVWPIALVAALALTATAVALAISTDRKH